MALTNAQYEEIMRSYDAKRIAKRNELDRRTAEVYLAVPRYKAILDSIGEMTVDAAKARIRGDKSLISTLSKRIALAEAEAKSVLSDAGFSTDYLQMQYDCELCKDTGFTDKQEKCSCFLQAEINLLYHQSNVSDIICTDNFDAFSYEYYSDTELIPNTAVSCRQNVQAIVKQVKAFIDRFPNEENLLFMGNTGVGKTFLTHCIAKEILDRSYSVLYVSAIDLFEYFSYKKQQDWDEEAPSVEHILSCDLLIIDDLGTEMSNSFTNSKLFQCINDRMIQRRSTIISTNLSLQDLMTTYSERIFSRVFSTYKTFKLVGDDIRVLKRKK